MELWPIAKPGVSCNCWMITQEYLVINLNSSVLTFSFVYSKALSLSQIKHIAMPVKEQIDPFNSCLIHCSNLL